MNTIFKITFLLFMGLCAIQPASGQVTAVARQADSILTQIYRFSGRNVDQLAQSTRQADLRMVENALSNFGPNARLAFENGGYAILQAGRQYGDEVIALAARNPDTARWVATNPEEALRIARTFGDDALRLENRVRGLLTHNPGLFNAREVNALTRLSPEAQQQVGQQIMRADSPLTARRMVQVTSEQGTSWIARIPTRYKIGTAIITGAVLDRAIFGPEGGVTGGIEKATKSLAWTVAQMTGLIVGGFLVIKLLLLFCLKYVFTWPIQKSKTTPSGPNI